MESAEIEAWLEQNRGQPRTGGVTAVDLLDLPDALGQLMRLVIAGGPLTEAQLRVALADAHDAVPWGDHELRHALTALCDQQWLLRLDDQVDGPRYSVNFRNTTRTPNTRRTRPIVDLDL